MFFAKLEIIKKKQTKDFCGILKRETDLKSTLP